MSQPDEGQYPGTPPRPPGDGQAPPYGGPPVTPQPPQYGQAPQYAQAPQSPYGQNPQYGYAPPSGAPMPKKPKTGLIITIVLVSVAALAALAVAAMVLLGAFSPNDADEAAGGDSTSVPQPTPTVEPTTTSEPAPTDSPDTSELDLSPRDPATPWPETTVTWQPGSAEAFAAREQFFIDQQLPLDGSALVATTPEQRTFIERQREHMANNGVQMTPQLETIFLAMTSDACETAILNAHNIDAAGYASFVDTSPIFIDLLGSSTGEERAAASESLESIMLFGMSYVCPGDVNDWALIYEERYDAYPQIY
ncbi:hypothetical protein GCM10009860_00760 [Microbacterium mitrae]|uniref:Uncharacterized protein n=1 Tax=Microbacterium mitrae TaxID=664640 RepID=A0A5C8HR94_9MICO|nr:hypothetical protein [Microbacterium mitrae]TXK05501.1 hypothetical protein FVP60_00415 [Microbacterium mitrae]